MLDILNAFLRLSHMFLFLQLLITPPPFQYYILTLDEEDFDLWIQGLFVMMNFVAANALLPIPPTQEVSFYNLMDMTGHNPGYPHTDFYIDVVRFPMRFWTLTGNLNI